MTKICGGELLACALANEGVKFVFSLPSPELDPILAGMETNGIHQVPYHDEIAGVHMAEGLYRESGQVGDGRTARQARSTPERPRRKAGQAQGTVRQAELGGAVGNWRNSLVHSGIR